MNWNVGSEKPNIQLSLDLEPDEQAVLNALQQQNGPIMIDELSVKTGLAQGLLASLLLTLEFKNAVISLPGKLYKGR